MKRPSNKENIVPIEFQTWMCVELSMIPSCLFLLFTILENNIHVRILSHIFNEHGDQAFWNLFFFFWEGFALLRKVTQPSMIRFHPCGDVTNLKTWLIVIVSTLSIYDPNGVLILLCSMRDPFVQAMTWPLNFCRISQIHLDLLAIQYDA